MPTPFSMVRWHGRAVRRLSQKREKEIWWGMDSEALTNGQPFLFCAVSEQRDQVHDRSFLTVLQQILASSRRKGRIHIFVYNLDYEVGAILRSLRASRDALAVLRMSRGRRWVEVREGTGVFVRVFPGRYMGIRYRGRLVWIWDAFVFFNMSLDKAAKKYLGKAKVDVGSREFTPDRVEKEWDVILTYCMEDARLTLELMLWLRERCREMGFEPRVHYSPAAYAAEWFRQNGYVENVASIWNAGDVGKKLLEYAWNAYRGGKFELVWVGTVEEAWEYDINSAYPWAMSQLYALRGARVFRSSMYMPDADYALIHAIIHIPPERYRPHPVGVWYNGVLVFPCGLFEAWITKDEYDYIADFAQIHIVDAFWIYTTKWRLYQDRVDTLYRLRRTEGPVRHLAKAMLNAFYGKLVQTVETEDGYLEPGLLWNPIHAGVITARVRAYVSQIQDELGEYCLAVHTDSVLTRIPLRMELIGEGLGLWKLSQRGRYTGLRSGVYELGEKVATQGYSNVKSWREELERNPDAGRLVVRAWRFRTWKEAAEAGDIDKANEQIWETRIVDWNRQQKRVLREKLTARDLLERAIQTEPLYLFSFDLAVAYGRLLGVREGEEVEL